MRVLFIGSKCASSLPFAEELFNKKLQEAQVTDIYVDSADMEEWGISASDDMRATGSHQAGQQEVKDLLRNADCIIVMERKQRNLLTKFLDYAHWSKILSFLDYCKGKTTQWASPVYGEFEYNTPDERVDDGCSSLVAYLKSLIKPAATPNVPMCL